VGLTLAVVITLEVGEVTRCATAEKLASYAGTTPRIHASGGKTRFDPSRPDVNRYLKWAFVESGERDLFDARAHAVSSRQSPLRTGRPAPGPREGHWGGGPALAEATYWMLSKEEPYREPKASCRFVHGDKTASMIAAPGNYGIVKERPGRTRFSCYHARAPSRTH
jgi:hypothetical protein